jgi:hypothetical protein
MSDDLKADIMAAARKVAVASFKDGIREERKRIIGLLKPLAEHDETATCYCDAYEHALYLIGELDA